MEHTEHLMENKYSRKYYQGLMGWHNCQSVLGLSMFQWAVIMAVVSLCTASAITYLPFASEKGIT